MRQLLLILLVACGNAPTAPRPGVESYVHEMYRTPSGKTDLLLVVDSAAAFDEASRDALIETLFAPATDVRVALTTTDIAGCDSAVLDGRCGRLLSIASQPFVDPEAMGKDAFRAALSTTLDAVETVATSPTTATQAALLAASALQDFLRAESALAVAILLPSIPAASGSNAITTERLRAVTGRRARLATMDRWEKLVTEYSRCTVLPAPPEGDDPANLHVELGEPGALVAVREASGGEDGEGWFYLPDDDKVCIVGATFHDWLDSGRVLHIQVVTRVSK